MPWYAALGCLASSSKHALGLLQLVSRSAANVYSSPSSCGVRPAITTTKSAAFTALVTALRSPEVVVRRRRDVDRSAVAMVPPATASRRRFDRHRLPVRPDDSAARSRAKSGEGTDGLGWVGIDAARAEVAPADIGGEVHAEAARLHREGDRGAHDGQILDRRADGQDPVVLEEDHALQRRALRQRQVGRVAGDRALRRVVDRDRLLEPDASREACRN